MSILLLEEIEPIQGDSYETVHYVSCDFCYQSAAWTMYNGQQQQIWYRIPGDGLIVCGDCVPGLDDIEEQS